MMVPKNGCTLHTFKKRLQEKTNIKHTHILNNKRLQVKNKHKTDSDSKPKGYKRKTSINKPWLIQPRKYCRYKLAFLKMMPKRRKKKGKTKKNKKL